MKVKTLISLLKKLPQDAEVIVENNSCSVDGFYKVTVKDTEYYEEDNTVLVGTDYEKRL